MLSLRRLPRLALKTGRIHSTSAKSVVLCALFNVGDTGACILVPGGNEVPETFELSIDPVGTTYLCKVAWRSGHRIRVSFQPRMGNLVESAHGAM